MAPGMPAVRAIQAAQAPARRPLWSSSFSPRLLAGRGEGARFSSPEVSAEAEVLAHPMMGEETRTLVVRFPRASPPSVDAPRIRGENRRDEPRSAHLGLESGLRPRWPGLRTDGRRGCRPAERTRPRVRGLPPTAADIRNLAVTTESFEGVAVVALVTAGARTNAQRAGVDRGDFVEWKTAPREARPLQSRRSGAGTVNVILLTNARLKDEAMARVLITATEAKVAAFEDMNVPSSYTPGGAGDGNRDGRDRRRFRNGPCRDVRRRPLPVRRDGGPGRQAGRGGRPPEAKRVRAASVTQVIILCLALFIDRLGDPPTAWHPVGWMGRFLSAGISLAESLFRADFRIGSSFPVSAWSRAAQVAFGAFWVLTGAIGAAGAAWLGLPGAAAMERRAFILASAVILKTTFSLAGLAAAAGRVKAALAAGIFERPVTPWPATS